MNKKKTNILFCWTELIQVPYTQRLVGGGLCHGLKTVGAINHYSDGTVEPVPTLKEKT